jgi:hypothetical protein
MQGTQKWPKKMLALKRLEANAKLRAVLAPPSRMNGRDGRPLPATKLTLDETLELMTEVMAIARKTLKKAHLEVDAIPGMPGDIAARMVDARMQQVPRLQGEFLATKGLAHQDLDIAARTYQNKEKFHAHMLKQQEIDQAQAAKLPKFRAPSGKGKGPRK